MQSELQRTTVLFFETLPRHSIETNDENLSHDRQFSDRDLNLVPLNINRAQYCLVNPLFVGMFFVEGGQSLETGRTDFISL
jgi:hypothetical protein